MHPDLKTSRKISAAMKERIQPYVTTGSRYANGKMLFLRMPDSLRRKTPKSAGVSLSADNKGFFVHTHRAASKRYASPHNIPKSVIELIESTG